jgi:hypothetical protein
MSIRLDRILSGPVVVSIWWSARAQGSPAATDLDRPGYPLYDQATDVGVDNVFGNNPADSRKTHLDPLMAQADADRAARLAGHTSLLRRVLERLRPHGQEHGGDPRSNHGTSDDPGH